MPNGGKPGGGIEGFICTGGGLGACPIRIMIFGLNVDETDRNES